MFANANMSSSASATSHPRKQSGKQIKKRPGKSGQRSRSSSAPPHSRGYDRYKGLESIRARPAEDRALPVGSRGKTPAEFRKYGQNTQGRDLDQDLNWTVD